MKSSIFCKIINGAAILALFISLLMSPNFLVSAQTNTDEPQNLTHHIYLPYTQREDYAYYVSPAGNDTNPGTFLRPWRTIGKASSMIMPGYTVFIRGGVYSEVVHFQTSGTGSNPIRILAYPGENPIIDGGNNNPGSGSALLWIQGDYIYTSGVEVRNSNYFGILVLGNYDVIDNMYVHHNHSTGILINLGHDSIVENSRIWRNSLDNEYGQGAEWGQGVSAARNGVSYATIRHNTVWENWGEGISSYEADHIVIEDNVIHDNYGNVYISDSTNVLFQRNFVYTDPSDSYIFPYGNHGGIALGDEKYTPPSANITIINNIAFGNRVNFWWWQGVQGGGMNNVLIANNTFVNAISDPNQGNGNVTISPGAHQNVRFENNLVEQDNSLPVIATIVQPGITYSHNLWSKTPYPAASGPGDIIGNPILSHADGQYSPRWFSLSDISPAIDHALVAPEVSVDFFDNPREVPPDIGADEFYPNP